MLLACSPDADQADRASPPPQALAAPFGAVREIASPAAAGSITPFLAAGSDGSVIMSWQEPDGPGHAIRMARLRGTIWSEPRTIVRDTDLFVNWADFPSVLELPDGSLAAHWLQREGPGTYAYGVRIARSSDDGRTWSEPVTPHLDGTLTEHGFVSLFPEREGWLGAVWLDGRDYARGEEAAAADAPEGEMSLRYAAIGPDGEIRSAMLLDGRACDCCQTDVALAAGDPLIVYRDRTEAEIRDIAIVRRLDGNWTPPTSVHEDGWHIPACPVNGPAVAASGERVSIAWYTAADAVPAVKVMFSGNAGTDYGQPIRVDEGQPLGRVDLLLLADGSAIVLWLETTAAGAALLARRVRADGSTSPAATLGLTDVGRSSGFPRMVRRGAELVLAWTDPAAGTLRTAVAPLRSE